MITRTKFASVTVIATLLVGMLLIPAPASADQIGHHDVTFNGYLANYPNAGQSTWFYTVTSNAFGSGGPNFPAISHIVFELGECLVYIDAGTWTGTLPNNITLNSGGGDASYITNDGSIGWTGSGIKFNQSFSSGETRRYYFTVTGATGVSTTNNIYLKGGNSFVPGVVGGPSCDPIDPPLAVVLSDFSAVCEAATPLISWTTLSETNVQGFNLYRGASADGWDAQVNAALIPAQNPGSTAGGSYQWLDTAATAGETHYYWLQDVSLDGSTNMHGPVSVYCNAPTAVRLNNLSAEGAAASSTLGWAALLAAVALAGGLIGLKRRVMLG